MSKNKVTYYTQDNCSFCVALEPHLRVFVDAMDLDLETVDVTGRFSVLKEVGGTVTPYLTLDTEEGKFILEERRVAAMIYEYKRLTQT